MPHPREGLKAKSDENWDAAEVFEGGDHPNSATSRYYYAVLEAAIYWATQVADYDCRRPPPDSHATIHNIVARQAKGEANRLTQLLNELKEQRVKADYRPESVDFQNDVAALLDDMVYARAFFFGQGTPT